MTSNPTTVLDDALAIMERQADEIERLRAENFVLAAGSCDVKGGKIGDERGNFYCTLQAALQQSRSEPEVMRYGFDGFGYKYIDSGSGSDWRTRHPDAEPLYLSQESAVLKEQSNDK